VGPWEEKRLGDDRTKRGGGAGKGFKGTERWGTKFPPSGGWEMVGGKKKEKAFWWDKKQVQRDRQTQKIKRKGGDPRLVQTTNKIAKSTGDRHRKRGNVIKNESEQERKRRTPFSGEGGRNWTLKRRVEKNTGLGKNNKTNAKKNSEGGGVFHHPRGQFNNKKVIKRVQSKGKNTMFPVGITPPNGPLTKAGKQK